MPVAVAVLIGFGGGFAGPTSGLSPELPDAQDATASVAPSLDATLTTLVGDTSPGGERNSNDLGLDDGGGAGGDDDLLPPGVAPTVPIPGPPEVTVPIDDGTSGSVGSLVDDVNSSVNGLLRPGQ